MPSQEFETAAYKLKLEEQEPSVIVTARLKTGRPKTPEDEEALRKFLLDMGKWETLAEAGTNLLAELGIMNAGAETPLQNQRNPIVDKYELEPLNWDDVRLIGFKISLVMKERTRRSEGDQFTAPPLRIDEVFGELKNVQKWRLLTEALKSIKSSV